MVVLRRWARDSSVGTDGFFPSAGPPARKGFALSINRSSNLPRVATAAAALLAASSAGRAVLAANCDTLTAPITYAVGGSSQTPFLGAVANAVAQAGGGTLVYASPGACDGVYAVAGSPVENLTGSVPAPPRLLAGWCPVS